MGKTPQRANEDLEESLTLPFVGERVIDIASDAEEGEHQGDDESEIEWDPMLEQQQKVEVEGYFRMRTALSNLECQAREKQREELIDEDSMIDDEAISIAML